MNAYLVLLLCQQSCNFTMAYTFYDNNLINELFLINYGKLWVDIQCICLSLNETYKDIGIINIDEKLF